MGNVAPLDFDVGVHPGEFAVGLSPGGTPQGACRSRRRFRTTRLGTHRNYTQKIRAKSGYAICDVRCGMCDARAVFHVASWDTGDGKGSIGIFEDRVAGMGGPTRIKSVNERQEGWCLENEGGLFFRRLPDVDNESGKKTQPSASECLGHVAWTRRFGGSSCRRGGQCQGPWIGSGAWGSLAWFKLQRWPLLLVAKCSRNMETANRKRKEGEEKTIHSKATADCFFRLHLNPNFT